MDHAGGVRLCRALVVAVLAVQAPFGRAACGGFGTGAATATGASPQAVTSADFDRDGIADLATANLSGASLTISRGLGGGAFAAPVGYASSTSARAIVAGDFNGDGAPDLAVGVTDGVAIWIGAGDGTFTGGAVVAAGAAVRGIACADFDRDGILDLAVTSSATNAVLVLRGRGANGIGDGTFAAPATYAVGANPARVLAADVDGDGITDLVVANNSGASASVLRGAGSNGIGNGAFAAASTIAVTGSPWSAVALDWNGDGLLDLVVSNGAGTFVTLLRGTGGGAFVSAGTVATPTAPRDLVTGDFDGDGRTDVAAACAAGNDVVLLRGTGAGLASLATFATGSGASALVAGDWNGDGAPDLACANTGAGTLTRLLGSCPAASTARVTLLAPRGSESWWPGSVQEARWTRGAGVSAVNVDLSRDGGVTWLPLARGLTSDRIAIPVVGVPDRHVRVRVADALVPARADASPADLTLCGVFGAPVSSPAGLAASQLASADLDGDGIPDLVACDATHAAVLRGDGAGHFAPVAGFAEDSTRRVVLADVTGDGLADLVRLTPGAIALRAGDGHGGFGPESRRPVTGGTGLVAADLDGDGVADLAVLAADGDGARLTVWHSSAPAAPWTAAVTGAPGALACADLDGDGIPDLALGSGASVQPWYGDAAGGRGAGTFHAGTSRTLPAPAGDLTLADADGDGSPDVIACLPATGDLVTVPSPSLANSSTGGSAGTDAATSPLAVAAGSRPCAPAAADLDGDGHPDLVLALAGESAIAVLAGDGAGFGAAVRFALPANPTALVVDDFTGDGQPDVAVACADGTVRCLAAQCPPRQAATLALAPLTFADTSTALAGFARTVSWTRSPAIAAVRVELSLDAGSHWVTLADAVTAYAWRWFAAVPVAAGARLRVRDAACGTRFDTGSPFAIREPFTAGGASAALAGGRRLATGDADGDGIADALASDGSALQLLRGDGAGGFAQTWQDADAGVLAVRFADVDGDGALDALALHAGSVSLRRGDGQGGFGEPLVVPVENGATDMVVADLDEDGIADLVTVSGDGNANRASVRLGRGAAGAAFASFAAPWYASLAAAPQALATADVNGDGIPDLVIAHAAGLATLLGNGAAGHGNGTFRLAGNRATGCGRAAAIAIADLDGDGLADVAIADAAGQSVLVAAGDGAGRFAAPAEIATGGAPVALTIADLDRDGAADLVAPLADGSVALLRGVAGAALPARFASAARLAAGGGAAAGACVDVDGDGVADVITLDPAGLLRVTLGRSRAAGAPRLAAAPAAAVTVGAAVPLHWTVPAGVAAVDVELSRDGGRAWTAIARGVTGGTWTWTASGPGTYAARLRVRDAAVPVACDSASAAFGIESAFAGVSGGAAAALRLGAPWPNPARGAAHLELTLPAPGALTVDVRDVAGRRARTLAAGTFAAGAHALLWNGDDDAGRPLPAGVYFVHARTPAGVLVRRVVLAR